MNMLIAKLKQVTNLLMCIIYKILRLIYIFIVPYNCNGGKRFANIFLKNKKKLQIFGFFVL